MKELRLTGLSVLCMLTTTVHAGIPNWSFSPNGIPVVSVTNTGTATFSYTVTNNSKKAYQLVLSPNTPAGISQSGGACILSGLGSSCTLTLNINGSALPSDNVSGGPILCQFNSNGTPNPNQCYQPNPMDKLVITRTTNSGATTLSASVSNLALSVNNPTLNAALSGNARHITITNTGSNPTTSLTVSYPAWPGGTPATTATDTCTGATLAANATCMITVTPGANATSGCNTSQSAPTPGVITLSATNVTTPVTTNVVVLSYGCQYQGGFLYSVNDTTSVTGSIGGKVATLVDQAAPSISSGPQASSIIWSSNGSGGASANVSYDIIPLIADSGSNASYDNAKIAFNATYSNTLACPFPASSSFTSCNGAKDGKCNTDNILALYDIYKTGYGDGSSPYTLAAGSTDHTYYAAGLCTANINTYSDWYLPAICELNAVNGSVNCPADTQSMLANLGDLIGDLYAQTPSTSCTPPTGSDCLAGYYWSSTEAPGIPQNCAWSESFDSSGSNQNCNDKRSQLGVRCSRALTL